MNDKEWQQANYPYDYITQRYRETIQYLNNSMRNDLSDLPEKLTDRQLEILSGLIGTETVEGLYILNALKQTEHVEGDVCEYGVAQGATSTLIADTISGLGKDLYLMTLSLEMLSNLLLLVIHILPQLRHIQRRRERLEFRIPTMVCMT